MQNITANTTNCIALLEIWLSPELPATMLTAQKLYNDAYVEVASFEGCGMFVKGGDNAEQPTMDDNDAILIGNWDFAYSVHWLLDMYAGAGNISTFAACASLTGCQVLNVDDTSQNKTGQIGVDFCVGGANLPRIAW